MPDSEIIPLSVSDTSPLDDHGHGSVSDVPDLGIIPLSISDTSPLDDHGHGSVSDAQASETMEFLPTKDAVESTPDRSTRVWGEVSPEWSDSFRERAGEAAWSSLESLAWRAAELIAAHFTPLGPLGPVLIRAIYLSRQAFTAVAGMADGKGFNLELGVPGLDLLDGKGILHGGVLPPGLQLVIFIRLGERVERRDGGVDVNAEIQVFKPWFEQIDIGEVREPREVNPSSRLYGVPTVVDPAEPTSADPWNEWLALLGRRLIDDLPSTISQAPALAFVMEINPAEPGSGIP